MTKILFICWGNICRSPAAALVFRELARREGLEDDFSTASAGVSDEEEGNGVYPPMRRVLEAHALDCAGHSARMLRRSDYEAFDLLVCMDALTIGRTRRFFGGDPEDKVRNLLDYAGRTGEEIDDPWYTRDFERAMREIELGCRAMLDSLRSVTLDLSACRDRAELYAGLREGLDLPDYCGSNLDALWDVLTEPGYRNRRCRLILPPEESPLASYAKLVRETLREAGVLAEEPSH